MSSEDVEHQPPEESQPTASDPVPDFESAALAVQNCLGRCKLGVVKVDMFCGTSISVQFVEVEQIYKDIISLATLESVEENENKDLESKTPQNESVDLKKLLEMLEESIMGVGATVVAQNSKLKAELGIGLPHIQKLIQINQMEIESRVSETQEEDQGANGHTQQISDAPGVDKDEDGVDISTIKLLKEPSSILSILDAISHSPESSIHSSGEYLKSIAEILDFIQGAVDDRKITSETKLQEHYALLGELSTIIDKVEELSAALEVRPVSD